MLLKARGHELCVAEAAAGEHAGKYFCRRCGMLGPSNVYEVRNYFRNRGRECQETETPIEQWALRPIPGFRRNAAARIREDYDKWTSKRVHGHTLEIHGERSTEIGTARIQVAYDESAERLYCTRCERTWPWAFRATITKQRLCTGDPKERREKLAREVTKLEEWLKEHKTTHSLAYSAIMGKWHCEQCWQSGSTVWNVNREHKGYNKDFIKLATTACEWHAAREGIT